MRIEEETAGDRASVALRVTFCPGGGNRWV
jgi:hypothetical protein